MSKQEKGSNRPVSRRDFLNISVVGGGCLVAVTLSEPASAAPKKFSQQQAHYQPVPKSGQRCQNCTLWQPPAACQQVEGQISPAGWCILYVPKT
jgi:anaerobic selenocysteine-containing dehydrogenase